MSADGATTPIQLSDVKAIKCGQDKRREKKLISSQCQKIDTRDSVLFVFGRLRILCADLLLSGRNLLLVYRNCYNQNGNGIKTAILYSTCQYYAGVFDSIKVFFFSC